MRFDAKGTAVFDWAQVRLHARFTGSQLAVYADTADNYLDVSVDGKLRAVLGPKPRVDDAPMNALWLASTPSSGKAYALQGLGPGEHRLLIAKRTGPNIGVVRLQGLRLEAGHRLLSPPPAQKRRIEFLGDSLTNAYGDEGPSLECKVLPPYENSSLSWARRTATELGAEAHLLAYSGYGVVRNYGEKKRQSADPYPIYYPRTVLAEKSRLWERDQFKPDLAVVFLGTNDHSTEPTPKAEDFSQGYRDLIAAAREGRGRLPVLCLYPVDREILAKRVEAIVAEEQSAGLPTQVLGLPAPKQDELGCDWHPKAVVHARWAKLAEPKIREMMKWTDK